VIKSACIDLLPFFATADGAGASGPVDVGRMRTPILRRGMPKHIRTHTEFAGTISTTTGP
jgi:hypothetical protein